MAYTPFTSRVDGAFTLSNLNDTVHTMQARQDAEAEQFDKVLERINNFNFAPEENEYRAKLVNDIIAVRNSFKEQNNGYLGANLTDIINAETKILTNPVIKAKEKYNADRELFMKQLDASGLDPDMIQMYKEDPANGYNFKTDYDAKGNEIGGNRFEGKRWATPIDRNELFTRALNIVKTKYGVVSPERIKEAINDAIKNTNGAEASFKQDYDVARWRYNKNLKENGGKPYIDENITDENGNILGTYENWIDSQINEFSKHRAWSDDNLRAYRGSAHSQLYRSGSGGGGGIGTSPYYTLNNMFSDNISRNSTPDNWSNRSSGGGPFVSVEKNDYNELSMIRNKANSNGFRLLKQHGFNIPGKANSFNSFWQSKSKYHVKGVNGPGQLYNYLVQNAKKAGNEFNQEEKIQLRKNIFDAYHAQQSIGNAAKTMNKNDSDALRFNNSVQTGEYKAGNSKYDDKILLGQNLIFDGKPGHESLDVFVSNNMINHLAEQYGSKYDFNSLSKVLNANITNYDDNYVRIRINANSKCDLARLASNLEKADSATGWTWNAFKNIFTGDRANDYYIRYINGDKFTSRDIKGNDRVYKEDNSLIGRMGYLSSTYNKGIEKAAKIEQKIGMNNAYVQMNTFGNDTFGGWYLDEALANGAKISDVKALKEIETNRLNDQLAGTALFDMYVGEIKNDLLDTNSINDSNDARTLIQKMYSDPSWAKQVGRQITDGQGVKVGNGNNPPTGYILSFTVPKGAGIGKYKEGEHYKFFISDGGKLEEKANQFQSRIEAKAQSIENIAYNTRSIADPIEYHDALGLCNVDYSNQTPVITFLNHKIPTNRETANKFIDRMMRLEGYKVAMYDDPSTIEFVIPQIDAISSSFAEITGIPKETIAKRLVYYLTYETRQYE